jgi:hypothetical protein
MIHFIAVQNVWPLTEELNSSGQWHRNSIRAKCMHNKTFPTYYVAFQYIKQTAANLRYAMQHKWNVFTWLGITPLLKNVVTIFSTFAASVLFRYDVPLALISSCPIW